jgi:autotransporter-associated beta strand protein
VRAVGTLGGSLALNDPAACYPAAVLGLGATVRTDRRTIPADAFFKGMYETALEPGELIVEVAFPVPQQAAWVKFKQPASRFSLVGVFVSRGPSGVRVAVTGAGAINLGTNRLTVGADTSEFSGRISGAGGLTKAGVGTFTLSGSNSFKGDTLVNDGRLILGSTTALGNASVVKVNSGGTLEATERVVVGFLDLNGGTIIGSNNLVSALTLINSGSVSGLANGTNYSAGILKRTTGIASVDGANSYTGTTRIEAGTVQLVEGGSFAAGSSLYLQSGGTMDLNGFSQTFSALDGTGGTVSLGAGNLTVDGAVDSQFAGVIGGAGGLVKSGSGTLTVLGANTHSGGTEVTGGRLVGNTTSLTGDIANSATVEFNQQSSATLGASITGNGGVVKSGIGTLTVASAQAYTGTTTVSAGDLKVNGSLAGAVAMESGASLSGSGAVGAISGAGEINPGNSPGILTATSLDPSGGLTFNFEFTSINPTFSSAAASVNDLLRLTDAAPFTASLTSANTVNIYFNVGAFGPEQTYTGAFFTDTQSDFLSQIADATFVYYVANTNGAFEYNGVNYTTLDESLDITIGTVNADGADFAGGSVNGQITQFEVVPEPSTYALLALAAAGLAAHALRRRRR